MIKLVLLHFLIFLSLLANGQNLTGTWEGNAMGNYCKLVVVHINDSLFGYTYDTGMGYCKADFVGKYDSISKKLKGENTEFIERTLMHTKSVYHLNYSKQSNSEYLKGRVAAKSAGAKILSFGIPMAAEYIKIKSTIDTTKFLASVLRVRDSLEKAATVMNQPVQAVKDTPASAVISKTDSTALLKKVYDSIVAIKESRNTIITRSITTAADTVTIILYDDGEIDGDIVTIFDNGKIMVNKFTLSKQPYEIKLTLPADNSKHIIELMAENEGSIPPNTAYMLVLAGDERIEVKASSDKLSNAAIVIQKDK